jgi:hypothetical protein
MGRALSKRADYAERILAAYGKAVDAFFETGQLLIEGKADLEHGEFLDMVTRDLPFSISTAERLMKIATDQRLAVQERNQLPARWTLLHAMSQLDDDEFAQLNVSPDMTSKDVEAAKAPNAATTLRFDFPLPPGQNEQLALNCVFRRAGGKRIPVYWFKHKEYEEWCDNLELAGKLPSAPAEPWQVWRITSVEFRFKKDATGKVAKRDPIELYTGLKWPVDWLVKRGYVKDDSLSELLLPLPTPDIVLDGTDAGATVVIQRVR